MYFCKDLILVTLKIILMQVLLNISLVDTDDSLAGSILDTELKAKEWIAVGDGSTLYVKTFRAISGFELSDSIENDVKEAGYKAELEEVRYLYAPISNPPSAAIVRPLEN